MKILSEVGLLLNLFLFFSCWNCSKDSPSDLLIDVNNNQVESLEMDNLNEEWEWVKLESGNGDNLVIYEFIDRFIVAEEYFFIFHRSIGDYSDVSIKVFSKQGDFVRKISIPQDGPTSFKVIKDVWFDGEYLELLDYGAQTIWRLNLYGQVVDKVDIQHTFDKFSKISDDIYAFDLDQSPNEIATENNLVLLKVAPQIAIVDQAVPIPPFLKGIGLQGTRFYKDQKNGNLYFYPIVGTELFHITQKDINKYAQLQFSSAVFDLEANPSMSTDRFIELKRNQRYIVSLDRFLTFGSRAITQYRYNGAFYWVLIDFKSRKARCFRPKLPFIKQTKIAYQPAAINTEGELILIISADDMVSYFEEMGDQLEENSVFQKIGKMALEDNPLIFKIPVGKLFDYAF